MKIHILYQGRSKKNIFETAESQFIERIKRYQKIELTGLTPVKHSKSLPLNLIRKKEEEHFENHIKPNTYRILLDEKGKEHDSISFSKYIERLRSTVNKDIVFVIGGAYGFSDEFKSSANDIIRLSKLTYSHHLARIVFLEQLYRSFTILSGEPYHNI